MNLITPIISAALIVATSSSVDDEIPYITTVGSQEYPQCSIEMDMSAHHFMKDMGFYDWVYACVDTSKGMDK